MAYVWDQNLTEDENRQREQEAGGGSGIIGAGAAAALPAGAQPGGGASSASGSFTNLQRYLDENKAGALDLGQKVAGQVTEAGQAAKTAAEGVVQQGQQQIEAARVQPSGIVDEAASSPTSVAADAAKKAAFQRERDASYSGPQALEDVEGFQTAQDAIKKFQDKSALTKSEAGRTTLLQDMGGPGYGRGKAVLNQLLLSGSPEAGQAVESAGTQFGNLQEYLAAQSDEARARAMAAREEADATRGAAASRFTGEGGVVPTFETELAGRVQAADQLRLQQNAAIQKIQDVVEGRAPRATMTPEEEAFFFGAPIPANVRGTSADPLTWLNQNRNALGPTWFNDYFAGTQAGEFAPDAATLASADDYARVAALEELLGLDIGSLDVTQAPRAGTYQGTKIGRYKPPTINQPRPMIRPMGI